MKTLTRKIKPNLLDTLKVSPIIFVNGPRQAGKSTLVQGLIKELGNKKNPAEYVSFDKPVQMAAAASEPETFLSSHEASCFIIDEVQMVPEIFRALKIVVDDLRRKNKAKANGRFLLTGSANILALPRLADPLVGRMSVMTLYPFCVAEALNNQGNGLDRLINQNFKSLQNHKLTLTDAIKLATFPEISNKKPSERAIWLDGYLTTILQREVRMLVEIEKTSLLPNLLRLLATRAGSLINDADIARDLGLNPVTEKAYRTILQMLFLTFNIRPWFRNLGKRLVKSSKGYLIDTLLLCHILDYRLEDLHKNKPDLFGHVVENFVATELLKLLTFSKIRAQLFHFRTSDGKEVDFVLERPDGSVFGIEVKTSELVDNRDFNGLRVLAALSKKDFIGGAVFYNGRDVVSFGDKLWALPFHILWQ